MNGLFLFYLSKNMLTLCYYPVLYPPLHLAMQLAFLALATQFEQNHSVFLNIYHVSPNIC